MKPIESIDEQAARVVRSYAELNELALIIRTNGDDVRVIAPDYDKEFMAQMLRIAAGMLASPTNRQVN